MRFRKRKKYPMQVLCLACHRTYNIPNIRGTFDVTCCGRTIARFYGDN